MRIVAAILLLLMPLATLWAEAVADDFKNQDGALGTIKPKEKESSEAEIVPYADSDGKNGKYYRYYKKTMPVGNQPDSRRIVLSVGSLLVTDEGLWHDCISRKFELRPGTHCVFSHEPLHVIQNRMCNPSCREHPEYFVVFTKDEGGIFVNSPYPWFEDFEPNFELKYKLYTLIEAISAQLTEQVRLILDDDPDVNTPDDGGNAPLHWATFMWISEENSYIYVDWLLAIPGININAQNGERMTALHQATELNRLGVVDRLLKYPGIDARLLNDKSETALSLAFQNNHDATIQRLLHHFGDRYFGWDDLEESKLLWDWASRLLHQSGKLVLFVEDTLAQTLQQSWNGWRKHLPEITREIEDFAKATGRVVAFTVSEAANGTGYLARLTLGDNLTNRIIECTNNACQAIYENTTPEQRVALSSVSFVIAGGVVGKIASRVVKKVPKGTMPKMANRGSTGRTTPRNLHEQLAMEEVMANPNGKHLDNIKMGDKRWPAEEGWRKMSQTVKVESSGVEVKVHYLENSKTGMFDDFKFKD